MFFYKFLCLLRKHDLMIAVIGLRNEYVFQNFLWIKTFCYRELCYSLRPECRLRINKNTPSIETTLALRQLNIHCKLKTYLTFSAPKHTIGFRYSLCFYAAAKQRIKVF